VNRVTFRVGLILTAFGSILLRWLIPPNPGFGSPHDDLLMVRLAAEIRAGNWLGEYANLGHLTLSKPAGFPLFLALSHRLPWAPTVTNHILVLSGAALVTLVLRRERVPRVVALLLFILVAFFPPFFGSHMSRIYREGLIVGLTFVMFGLSLHLASDIRNRRAFEGPSRYRIALSTIEAFMLGLTVGFAISVKAGWYPLAITVLVTLVPAIAYLREKDWRQRLAKGCTILLVVSVGMAITPSYIIYQNNAKYGISRLDSYADGPFAEAMNWWTSVRSDQPQRYVLVDKSQRSKVYEVSETARSLSPHLEYGEGVGWRGQSCASPLKICDESSAWFPWELRDAVQASGLGNTAEDFDRTLQSLVSDIQAGCEDGRLDCGDRGLAPGVLALPEISTRLLVDGFGSAFNHLLTPAAFGTQRGPYDHVPQEEWALWHETVRGLPVRDVETLYRPDAFYLGSIIVLLERLYDAIWEPLLLVSVIGLCLRKRDPRAIHGLRLACLSGVTFGVLMLFQLAVLEASSGMYILGGGSLYLLPVFPAVLLFVSCGIGQLAIQISEGYSIGRSLDEDP